MGKFTRTVAKPRSADEFVQNAGEMPIKLTALDHTNTGINTKQNNAPGTAYGTSMNTGIDTDTGSDINSGIDIDSDTDTNIHTNTGIGMNANTNTGINTKRSRARAKAWENYKRKATAKNIFNLRLNDYYLAILRHLADQDDETSMQQIVKDILLPELEKRAGIRIDE